MISCASPLTASSVGFVSPGGTVVAAVAEVAGALEATVPADAVVTGVDGLVESLVEPLSLPHAASVSAMAAGTSSARGRFHMAGYASNGPLQRVRGAGPAPGPGWAPSGRTFGATAGGRDDRGHPAGPAGRRW